MKERRKEKKERKMRSETKNRTYGEQCPDEVGVARSYSPGESASLSLAALSCFHLKNNCIIFIYLSYTLSNSTKHQGGGGEE